MNWPNPMAMEGLPANGAPSLKVSLAWSLALHSILTGLFVLSTVLSHRGESWGGTGAGMTVGLVRNVAGVPLPRPAVVTQSRVVDQTQGLHREQPKKPTPIPQATQIPEFERNKPPKYISRPSRVLEDETPPPQGAIPYGQGGGPAVAYSQFTMSGHSEGGLAFGGPGGEFSARYPWYVEAVRRRISNSWLQSTIDPSVRWAPRVVVTFQILSDGTVANLQFLRSSGNASVDNSARRAILDSSPLERLPAGYSGSYVSVEFWFEFRR